MRTSEKVDGVHMRIKSSFYRYEYRQTCSSSLKKTTKKKNNPQQTTCQALKDNSGAK